MLYQSGRGGKKYVRAVGQNTLPPDVEPGPVLIAVVDQPPEVQTVQHSGIYRGADPQQGVVALVLSGFVVDKPAQDPVVVSQQTGMLVVRQVEHRGQGIDGDVGLRVPALFLMVLPMGVPGEADGGGLEVEDLMVPVQLG